jgi:hypothetical protein
MIATFVEEGMPRETGIEHPSVHDVLIGRGNFVLNHVGNGRLRDLVDMYFYRHEKCKLKIEKIMVIATIISQVMDSGGRFMKKDPVTKTWFTVDRKAASEKVVKAIQNKLATENKQT